MNRPFDIEVAVRSYELDALRHTNNAIYLKWMEHARLHVFEELGFGVSALVEGRVLYNIVRAEIDFRSPTFFGDRVIVGTQLEGIGTSSVRLRHPMHRARDGAVVCETREVVVWLGPDGRPTPVPEDVRTALETLDRAQESEGETAT